MTSRIRTGLLAVTLLAVGVSLPACSQQTVDSAKTAVSEAADAVPTAPAAVPSRSADPAPVPSRTQALTAAPDVTDPAPSGPGEDRPTATQTRTERETATETATRTQVATATRTQTQTATQTETATRTEKATRTVTATASGEPSPQPTASGDAASSTSSPLGRWLLAIVALIAAGAIAAVLMSRRRRRDGWDASVATVLPALTAFADVTLPDMISGPSAASASWPATRAAVEQARSVLQRLAPDAPDDERGTAATRLLQVAGEARAAVDVREATMQSGFQPIHAEPGSNEDLLRWRDELREALAAATALVTPPTGH